MNMNRTSCGWQRLQIELQSSKAETFEEAFSQDLPPFHPPPSSPSLKMQNLYFLFRWIQDEGKYIFGICSIFGISGRNICFCCCFSCPQDKKTFVEFVSLCIPQSSVMVADIFTCKVHQFEQKTFNVLFHFDFDKHQSKLYRSPCQKLPIESE